MNDSDTSQNRLCGDARWYVVQTLARQEARARAQLEAQGFTLFFPRVLRTIRHARKLRTAHVAAFPGYFFIALDLERDRWRSVNGTFGVSSLIMGHTHPTPAPRGVVEALQAYADPAGVLHLDRDLNEGQAVRIKHGPLTDAVGELVRLDSGGRVRVLLEIMGGKVQTEIERASLEAA
ncbi:MAG: transcription antiterminator NusG [Hyphomicrobiales bacterium]|nr:transcription antiterminator NusG [Hyphomicrobiales bacterium]